MDYGSFHYDLDRCRDFLEDQLYDEAWALARELYARSPENAEVVGVYSFAALSQQEAGAAVRACRRLLQNGIEDIDVLDALVHAQWDLGMYEPCRATCRRMLEHDPTNYTALDFGLATLLELGDFDRGEDLIEKAIAGHGGDPHLEYQTAVARMMRGEEAWALGAFEEFVRREPDADKHYINLMRLHHLAGRYGRVHEVYELAVARGLDHADLDFNMGFALKAEERDREAVPYFVRALRFAEEAEEELPDACFHLGQILRAEGHPKLALAVLHRELDIDDTHPAVHAEMAWCAEDLGDYALAIRMIRAAVERAPDWGIYQHSLAELLMKEDPGSAEAEEVAQKAIALDPHHAAGWQILGRIAMVRGQHAAAEDCLRRAVRLKDATAEDQGWLGLHLIATGRLDESRSHLEIAARIFPFWEPVADALGEVRGAPLPHRFEVRLTGSDERGATWFRVLHVVDENESGALGRPEVRSAGGVVDAVRALGVEVDHEPGVLWDSGRTDRRYPPMPSEDSSAD